MPKTIKELPEHSRPREKLRERGVAALTDEELVAAILGMGTACTDVRTMSRQVAELIKEHRENLTLDNLLSVPGVGLAKGGQILSAFELARRYLLHECVKIESADDVLPLLTDIRTKSQEHFVCLTLNGANELIQKRIVTIGLPIEALFTHATYSPTSSPIELLPSSLLIITLQVIKPSDEDLKTQNILSEAAKLLGIRVLDHNRGQDRIL